MSAPEESRSEVEDVVLRGHGGAVVMAELFRPVGARRAPAPGVVLVHEVYGVDRNMRRLAGELADAGFAVILPDLYSRAGCPGPESTDDDPAPEWDADLVRRSIEELSDNQALGDLEAARVALAGREDVDGDRILAWGLSSGGTLAYLFGCRSDVAGIVSFGGPIVRSELSGNHPVQPLEMTLNLSCPVFGAYGENDPSTPLEHVELLRRALSQAHKHFDIVVCQGAGHGFANADRPGSHPSATRDAFARALAFLRDSIELGDSVDPD